jgi:signal transduction histidine kinase
MTLLASLTNRIFLASALLAVTTTGVAVWVVRARATREAEVELSRGLSDAGDLVAQQQRSLTANFVLFARLLADLPKFKAAIETQSPPTVAPIAEEYRQQVGADMLVVTGRDGTVLARGGESGIDPLPSTVKRAVGGQEAMEFRAHPRGILQVVTVPVSVGLEIPDVLGTISLGMLLDRRLADKFKAGTRSDVAFELDGRVRAATLPAAAWGALTSGIGDEGATRVQAGDVEYVALAQLLHSRADPGPPLVAGTSARAVVLQSRTERLQFLRTIDTALGLAALVAVILATGLSYAVARTITHPLGAITNTMREMAATGDLARKITLRGPSVLRDEDARLLAATFNTLTDSIARFQREAAQRERLLALGRLSTVIAHEIRNPLMIIKATLRTLRPDAPVPDLQEAVRDIDGEIQRLNRIVNDVLDFARPPVFSMEATDLVRVCRDAAEAASAVGEGPPVETDAPATPLMATTDPVRLRTALVNILANARQAVAARDGDRTAPESDGSVRLSLRPHGDGRVRVQVADRGVGIRPEDLSQIFEPYFTTRRSGTGLGLPIARNIIEGLGGTLSVRSDADGTIIDIDLPQHPPTGLSRS